MKLLLKVILFCLFGYMLVSPWLDKSAQSLVSDKEETLPKPIVKEKPLHNVKLPDFVNMRNVQKRKKAFFDLLRPYIVAENKRILKQREQVDLALTELELGFAIPKYQINALKDIFAKYKIDDEINEESLTVALNRVDSIPIAMVLTQAANESGWGTSRFARIGLNFFGLWCFREGCGMVPNQRNEGRNHEVAAFKSLEQSVKAYFRNINTHPAYQQLRDLRQSNRYDEQIILAEKLLYGLGSYSERGHAYIEELNQMLVTNQRYFSE
ncbi:glucosaminidase domain-containing protein [Pseudoalteromonas sp.]|uniref:glucosaminidase domain-containing protein n=1 Tax=Pseudoalteromonas sp. TaxID=53249 RepID=UPI003566BC54